MAVTAPLGVAIGLLMAIFMVFWGSLDNPFQYDDIHSVVENPHIRSLLDPLRFVVDAEMFSADPRQAMYRPVVVLSLAINHALGAYNPTGYHVFNLALHAANALLVLALARIWGLGLGSATFSAALFAFHPVNVEALNLISSRSESLCAFFFLAAFLSFLHYLKNTENKRWYWAALGFYGVSLGAKSVGIMLPAVLLVYEFWVVGERPNRKDIVQRHGAFWLLTVAYLAGVRQFLAMAVVAQPVRPLAEQIWTQAKALVYYLKLLFLPHSLSIEHQFRPSESPFESAVLVALLLVVSLGLGCLGRRRQGRRLVFWLVWVGVVLLPTLIVPLNILVNEHRLYLPSVGFALGIGLLFDRLWPGRMALASVGLVVMLLLLALLARQRTQVWQTPDQLWNDAMQKGPLMPRPYIYWGDALRRTGRHQEALAAYTRARTVNPAVLSGMDLVTIHNNSGSTWLAMGQMDEAIAAYRRALALDPHYAKARESLAALTAIAQQQWNPAAEMLYKQAMRHLVTAELEQAVTLLNEALAIQEQPETYIALGLACQRQNDPKGAWQAYKTLVERFPASPLSRTAKKKLALLEGGRQ